MTDRDMYDNLAKTARSKSLEYMIKANTWIDEMMSGTRPNTADTRDAIKVMCMVSDSNIILSNQLRDHVRYLDVESSAPQMPTPAEQPPEPVQEPAGEVVP